MATEKENILEDIEKAWNELQNVLNRVPQERKEQSGVVEHWSVKDIMGHVTTWEDFAMTALSCFVRERDPALLAAHDVDAFNKRTSDAKKTVPMKSILYDFNKSHSRTIEYLRGLADKEFTIPQLTGRVVADTSDHYREHAEHIQFWLEK